MRLLDYFKKRRKSNEETDFKLSYWDFYLMNDSNYIDNMRKLHPDKYAKVVNRLKKLHGNSLENCLSCCAFYWDENDENQRPACTLGGDFTGIDEWEGTCKNCPLKGDTETKEGD